jgi:hypothetical protein
MHKRHFASESRDKEDHILTQCQSAISKCHILDSVTFGYTPQATQTHKDRHKTQPTIIPPPSVIYSKQRLFCVKAYHEW